MFQNRTSVTVGNLNGPPVVETTIWDVVIQEFEAFPAVIDRLRDHDLRPPTARGMNRETASNGVSN